MPPTTPEAQRLYDEEVDDLGYVMNVSRLWAQSPATVDALFDRMGEATTLGGLTFRPRGILVTATASALVDAYCALAEQAPPAVQDAVTFGRPFGTGDSAQEEAASRL